MDGNRDKGGPVSIWSASFHSAVPEPGFTLTGPPRRPLKIVNPGCQASAGAAIFSCLYVLFMF
jgi:hypothetical protein